MKKERKDGKDGDRPDGAECVAGAEGTPALPMPLQQQASGDLVLPSSEEFALIRMRAREAGTLKDLRQMVAAWQAVAEKCHLAFEEMMRLAVFRLEVERDLGVHLSQTVKRGGFRSNLPSGSLLPDGVSWKQSAAYQKLAAIPEDVFRSYIEKAGAGQTPPSSAGARRFASPKKPHAPRRAKAQAGEPLNLPPAVLDAISRVMTPDVVVGNVKIQAKRFVSPNSKDTLGQLEGDVLVAECLDPAAWLPNLIRLRNKARIREAITIARADVWADWFGLVTEGSASCCFLRGVQDGRGTGWVVLHHGAGAAAFRVAMASVGVVVHA